jgi:long-chain acyl-CoA synthetase
MEFSHLKPDIELSVFEENIGSMILNRVEKFSEKLAIQERDYNSFAKITWIELFTKIKKLGLGLISLGIEKEDKVAVLCKDCIDVLAFELACMSIGSIFVPLFSGYYPKQIEYVISHSDPRFVVVSDDAQLEKILSTMATGSIEKYFMLDYPEKYLESTRIFDFNLLYQNNANENLFFEKLKLVNKDDICLLIYTSGGTTGISKGVPLTHKNLLGQQKALSQVWDITEKDIILSYFPWHQSLGIVEKFASLYSGACLTLDRTPGIDDLPKSLEVLKPTVYFGSAKIFHELIIEMQEKPELESLFFHDKVNFAFASSSPSQDVLQFFKRKNVPLLQGWGLTEAMQYITVNSKKDKWFLNRAGYPIPGTEIRINGEENEICIKGVTLMGGYYKDAERTSQSFVDGWFKTGDAGNITEEGLKILGRIDSLFYLKDQTKIYPSDLEQKIENSSLYISYCLIFGDEKEYISALIFPSIYTLKNWYENKNNYSLPLVDILDEQEVIDLYKNELKRINETDNYNLSNEGKIIEFSETSQHPKIKKFTLVENELTLKAGELTSAMTMVRKMVIENYSDLIEAFYHDETLSEFRGRIINI